MDAALGHVRERQGEGRDGQDDDENRKCSTAAVLVDIATQRYRFACTPEGEPFGVPAEGGHVVRMLRGGRTGLRAELAREYRAQTGKVPAQQALADALMVLEGEAQDAAPEVVHLRIAQSDGAVWIDLGSVDETCVKVDAQGWQVVTDGVPVLFRRTALTGELPAPVPGNLDDLWDLVNVSPDDRPMVRAWMVAALAAPDIPHPIIALFGEQGTGKSTASRNLVDLVDPSPVPLRQPPRDKESWVTAAQGSWVVGLDNLSQVPEWLSDSLCRAATGDGDVRRALYTDSGLSVFAFRRAVLLNGIDLGGLRADMGERLVTVQLDPIPATERRTETDLTARWDTARPGLFGGLLDEVAGVIRVLPSVRLDSAPRMADFARVLAALDLRHGEDGLMRYVEQGAKIAADSLASDPFVNMLVNALRAPFEGSAAELLDRFPVEGRPLKGWPSSARQVTTVLTRNAPALRSQGWTVKRTERGGKSNSVRWSLTPPSGDTARGKCDQREARNVAADAATPPNSPPTAQTWAATGRQHSGVTPPTPPPAATPPLCRPDAATLPPHVSPDGSAFGGKAAKAATIPGNLSDDTGERVPAVRERTNTVPDAPEGDTETVASIFPPCHAPGCTQDLWSPESQRLGYCSKHRYLSEGKAS
jgi:hypothetical protein